MPEITRDSHTIIKFMDVEASGRVYRGEKLLHVLEEGPLNGFEVALKSFDKKYQRLHLFAHDWEIMADFAFSAEWKRRPLSELLAAAKERGIDVAIYH